MKKYFNQITTVDGIKFASKKEARRYQELKLLEQGGRIWKLKLQPKFLLQEGFTARFLNELDAVYESKVRPIYYIGDFEYRQHENNLKCKEALQIVEDVKGIKTPVYELKKKMFLKLYGELYFLKEI